MDRFWSEIITNTVNIKGTSVIYVLLSWIVIFRHLAYPIFDTQGIISIYYNNKNNDNNNNKKNSIINNNNNNNISYYYFI